MSDDVMQHELVERARESGALTKADITKAWFIYWLGAEVSSSYERLQSLIFCASMTPIIKKLYPQKEEQVEALKRHLNFFNSEQTFGAVIQGISIAMEEYSAAIFLIPICISFDTAEKRRYATYLILNRRFSFEF